MSFFRKKKTLLQPRFTPEYLTEERSWEQLSKINAVELKKLNVTLKTAIGIDAIKATENTIIDSNGIAHSYDQLILATGSRSFVPENAQLHLAGRFTIRKKRTLTNSNIT